MQSSVFSFVVVRHGQTEWNVAGIFQGHLDSALTDVGIRQAEEIGKMFACLGIKILVSSDLGRAIKTAEIVKSILNIDHYFSVPYFRERNLGSIQGVSREDLLAQSPSLIDSSGKIINYESVPGLESATDFSGRIWTGLKFLITLSSQGPIAVIAHGGVIRFLDSLVYADSEVHPIFKHISHSEIHTFTLNLTERKLFCG